MRRWRPALLALLAALIASACGVTTQESPRAIAAENVPAGLLDPELPTETAPPTPGGTPVPVYFVRLVGDSPVLVATERRVERPGTVAARLQALLSEPPTAVERETLNLKTAIPEGAALNAVTVRGDQPHAVIDLSREFREGPNPHQRHAFAQLVFTATEVPDITSVSFRVDGEPIPALIGDGSLRDGPVSQADYREMRPSPP